MWCGDNVTSDSNYAGQESHCEEIAFALTTTSVSTGFQKCDVSENTMAAIFAKFCSFYCIIYDLLLTQPAYN